MHSSCSCSNSVGNTLIETGQTLQRPIENCHELCPGNDEPNIYGYCGSDSRFEQLYEGAPNVSAVPSKYLQACFWAQLISNQLPSQSVPGRRRAATRTTSAIFQLLLQMVLHSASEMSTNAWNGVEKPATDMRDSRRSLPTLLKPTMTLAEPPANVAIISHLQVTWSTQQSIVTAHVQPLHWEAAS